MLGQCSLRHGFPVCSSGGKFEPEVILLAVGRKCCNFGGAILVFAAFGLDGGGDRDEQVPTAQLAGSNPRTEEFFS